MLVRGFADQPEKGRVLLLAVDDELSVENLVATVFRVDLRETEYLAIGQLTPYAPADVLQVGDLFFAERQPFLFVVSGVVVFWVALSIFSMIHGTAKGIKDGYLQGDAEDSDDAKQIYTPNPEWMGEMDLVDSRKNAKILAPQFLKQARESARILETTTDPATFFMRYDFCVGRLLELEKCKRYGAPVSATADLKKYQNPVFREAAVNEIIHRTAEKYSVKIRSLKTTKAKKGWAEKYHQAFVPFLQYMSDAQKTELGEASAELFALAESNSLEDV